MSAHITDQISDYLDDSLGGVERDRVNAHLRTCDECRAQEAEMRAAVAAVRALPHARMPVPVVLPFSAPVSGRSRWLRPQVISWVGAAAAIAAGVGIFSLSQHQTPAAVASGGSASIDAPAAPGAIKPNVGGVADKAATACVVAAAGSASQAVPPGFEAATSTTSGSTTLELATTSEHVTPGQRVLVYSRASEKSGAVLPCVELVSPTEGTPVYAPNAALSTGASGGALVPGGTSVWAEPTSGVNAGGIPLLVVAVPSSATPGTTYQLIAEVPASAGHPAVTVTLTLVVD